jgi:diacylglycerol kinase (ATP)
VRARLVVNERSRRGRAIRTLVRDELLGRGVEIVGDGPIDCIVAAGGDGTLVRLIPRAIELGVPVGLIPSGTFNELARTLGIPFEIGAACDAIVAGRTRTIDVARVNGVHYVNEASIGISSRAARLQTGEFKRRFGFLAVISSVLRALWYSRPMEAAVVFGQTLERFRTVQLTIANSSRFGGLFSVGDAAIDDGWLDLYSVEIEGVREAFSVARAALQGKRQSVPGLRMLRSARFDVQTRRPHRISADGEPAGVTPAVFEVLPKALRVIVPE